MVNKEDSKGGEDSSRVANKDGEDNKVVSKVVSKDGVTLEVNNLLDGANKEAKAMVNKEVRAMVSKADGDLKTLTINNSSLNYNKQFKACLLLRS
jgi:hypothetical protein